MKKNYLIKVLACSLITVCSVFMLASAADTKLSAEQAFSQATQSIDTMETVQLNTAQPLYNLADNQVAYMFYLQPQGYIIADDLGRVLEYNLEGNHRFFENPQEHYYYGGIFSYMIKEGSQIIDLTTQEPIAATANLLSNEAVDYSSDAFWKEDSLELSSSYGMTKASAQQWNLRNSTRMYNCNNKNNWSYFGVSEDSGGVCGSVALGIMTAYMDDYHTDSTHNWCQDGKKTSNSTSSYMYGRDLVKDIIARVEPSGNGSFLLGSYTYYLQDQGIWDRQLSVALTENGSWDSAKASILKDYPCVVGVGSGFTGEYNTYSAHFMTVVSVSTASSGAKYYHVNCGWGGSTGNNGYDKLNANGKNIGRVYYLQNI